MNYHRMSLFLFSIRYGLTLSCHRRRVCSEEQMNLVETCNPRFLSLLRFVVNALSLSVFGHADIIERSVTQDLLSPLITHRLY